MLLLRLPGLLLLRLATRAFAGLLFQLPPRLTRFDPEEAPMKEMIAKCMCPGKLYMRYHGRYPVASLSLGQFEMPDVIPDFVCLFSAPDT